MSNEGHQIVMIGTKAWFAIVVKLPCGGLNLSRDYNQVANEEVTAIFGPKLKCRGYQHFEAKEKDVKGRLDELYPVSRIPI